MKLPTDDERCNQKYRQLELDLFAPEQPKPQPQPEPQSPLAGLTIRLERKDHSPVACNNCGKVQATLGSSAGPHAARIFCPCCNNHRGWLGKHTAAFILEIVTHYGVPNDGIVVRWGR
jgi:hypothetical protein